MSDLDTIKNLLERRRIIFKVNLQIHGHPNENELYDNLEIIVADNDDPDLKRITNMYFGKNKELISIVGSEYF